MNKKVLFISLGIGVLALLGVGFFFYNKGKSAAYSDDYYKAEGIDTTKAQYGKISDYEVNNSYRRTPMNDANLYLVELDGYYGVIDVDGDFVIPLRYSYLDNQINAHGTIRAQLDGKWGYITTNNTTVVPFRYDYIGYYDESVVSAEMDKKYGTLDAKGNILIPFDYTYIGEFDGNIAPAIKNKKLGFIGRKGETLIPFEYDVDGDDTYSYFTGFNDDLANIKKGGKWGFINKNGQNIIPFEYDEVKSFQNGYAAVIKGEKAGFINKKNEVVVPFELDPELYNYAYEDGGEEEDMTTYAFNEFNKAIVKKDGKFGVIDPKGTWLVAPTYEFVEFANNEHLVIKEGDKWGVKTFSGETLIPVDKNYISVYLKGKYFSYYDEKGKKDIMYNTKGELVSDKEAERVQDEESKALSQEG